MATKREKGTSLAKGPIALVGMILLAYGVTGLIFGGHGFTAHAISGTVNGKSWLGLEVNGWSNLLFIGGGALLLFGAPLHWGAKTMGLLVGLGFAAAAVIALIDGDDVLGIFAANGRTKLVWAIVGAVLIVLALLPRVGGRKKVEEDTRPIERTRGGRFDGDEPARNGEQAGSVSAFER